MKLERLSLEEVKWSELDASADRMVAQTRGWLQYLVRTQGGEIVVARLTDGGETLGHFTGLLVRRLGLRVLGSPMDGWGTPFMGFNLRPDVGPSEALRAAVPLAFRELGCLHFEVRDRRLTIEEGANLGFAHRTRQSFETDLTQDEDAIFAAMDGACRRCVRKAEKSGVLVEDADPEGFGSEYHAQLVDVFAKQGLPPPYGVARVQALIDALHPTGNLVLLRARDREGESIATGIYPGFRNWAFFWGNASWRTHQGNRPNEALHWSAMRRWKEKGAKVFDWGGGGDYKRKYGVKEVHNPHFYQSRYAAISWMRGIAYASYRRSRVVKRGLAVVRGESEMQNDQC